MFFAKCLISDIWQGSKCSSVLYRILLVIIYVKKLYLINDQCFPQIETRDLIWNQSTWLVSFWGNTGHRFFCIFIYFDSYTRKLVKPTKGLFENFFRSSWFRNVIIEQIYIWLYLVFNKDLIFVTIYLICCVHFTWIVYVPKCQKLRIFVLYS